MQSELRIECVGTVSLLKAASLLRCMEKIAKLDDGRQAPSVTQKQATGVIFRVPLRIFPDAGVFPGREKLCACMVIPLLAVKCTYTTCTCRMVILRLPE